MARIGFPAITEPRGADSDIRRAVSNIRQRIEALESELTTASSTAQASSFTSGQTIAGLQARIKALEDAIAGIVNGGSTDPTTITLVAGETIAAGAAVSVAGSLAVTTIPSDASRAYSCIGVAVAAASSGGSVTVKVFGDLNLGAGSLTAGSPVYVASNGALTHTPTTPVVIDIATATASAGIFVDPRGPAIGAAFSATYDPFTPVTYDYTKHAIALAASYNLQVNGVTYKTGTDAIATVPENITTAKQFLTQTGTGVASNPPTWGRIQTADVDVPVVGTPTYKTLADFINTMMSPGIVTGGVLSTPGSNTLNISAGTAVLRVADDDVSTLRALNFSLATFAVPTDGFTRFYGLTYNAGTPVIVQRTTNVWDNDTEIPLGSAAYVVSSGTLLTFSNPFKVGDPITNVIQRFDAIAPAQRDESVGGLALTDGATNQAGISAGKIWARLNDYNKTTRTSAANPMLSVYWNGTSLALTPGLTAWDNTRFNNVAGGTLQVMGNNKYACLWFFTHVETGVWGWAYGTAEYNNIGDASLEGFPAYLTANFNSQTLLVGRMIFQKNATSAAVVESAFTSRFVAAPVNDHNNLSGLQGGAASQYYHLNASDFTDLSAFAALATTGALRRTGEGTYTAGVIPITDISMNTARLLGRTTADVGAAEEITVGAGLSLSGGSLTATGGSGGMPTGGGTDKVFYENDTHVTANYTITTNKNAMSAGPITVDTGVVVTVPTNSVWTIV